MNFNTVRNWAQIGSTAVVLVLALALAACGGGGGDGGGVVPPPAPTEVTVGPAGGTVTDASGAQVVVPAGALAQATTISVGQSSKGAPPLPAGVTVFGPMFAFTPHGTAFAAPVTITVPFDPALVPAGARPTLYKTNAGQSAFEPVPGATVVGATMMAQVTGFSHANVGDEPKNGVQRNDPVRTWNIARMSGNFLEPREEGTQTAGEVVKRGVFGASDPAFELDGGASPGVLRGEVFSSADGTTYWAGVEAPGRAALTQSQSFIKRAADATLQVVVTDSYLRVIDGNGGPLPGLCPRLTDGMTEAQINSACHPTSAKILFRVKAFKGSGSSPNPILDPDKLFFNVGSFAELAGFTGHWKFSTALAFGASSNAFTTANFNQDTTNSIFRSATLNGSLVFDVDLSSVEVCPFPLSQEACKDKAFTLESIVTATALTLGGRESGAAAFFRDPLSTGGSTLRLTGLEASNDPAPSPQPGVQTPLACTNGPNPAAGVLQFGEASYTLLEGPLSELSVLVTRTLGSQGAVSVTFSASDGTAATGVDYSAPAFTVHFADGDTLPRVATVTALPDSVVEPDKTLTLSLSDPGGCATLGAQASALVTILDDVRPPPPPPPSGLDVGFGIAGKTSSTEPGGPGTRGFGGDRSAMALQADGKIVMVGGTFTDFILARFNADGSLDTSFGIDGKVTTEMGGGDFEQEEALGVAIQADGKIVVVGHTSIHTSPPAPKLPPTFALARYTSDGNLDPSFGTGGRVSANVNGIAYAVVIQPDGKIVVAGEFSFASSNGSDFSDFTVARFNSNGSLDLGFGGSGTGQVATDIGSSSNSARNIALQANGAIVVSGKPPGSQPGFDHTDIARYTASGLLDASFGSGGKLTLVGVDVGQGLARQADGKFVMVGSVIEATVPATARFLLKRLNLDGGPDTTFGNAGTVETAFTQSATAGGVALQGDGKVVVVGTRAFSANANFIVARYNANGSVDTGFGIDGNLSIDFFGFNDIGENVLVQPDGKIVVSGQAQHNFDGYGLARINP